MENIIEHKLNSFRRKANLYKAGAGSLLVTILIVCGSVVYALLNATFIQSAGLRQIFFILFIIFALALLTFYTIQFLYQAFRTFSFTDYVITAKKLPVDRNNLHETFVQGLELQKLQKNNASVLINKALSAIVTVVSAMQLTAYIRFAAYWKQYRRTALAAFLIIVLNVLFFPDSLVLGYNNFNPFKKTVNLYNFELTINSDSLEVAKGKDFELFFSLEGKLKPTDVHVSMGNAIFYADRVEGNTYKFKFVRVIEELPFRIGAAGFSSELLRISPIPIPVLVETSIAIIPPAYTGGKPFLYVPGNEVLQHSRITFNFKVYDTDQLLFNGDTVLAKSNNLFSNEFVADSSFNYLVEILNAKSGLRDAMNGSMEVKPDFYPVIAVNHSIDSANLKTYYFSGTISDDYGFHELFFEIADADNKYKVIETIALPINAKLLNQNFYFTFDYNEIENSKLAWRFSVRDNDVVSGYKKSVYGFHDFIVKNSEELNKMVTDLQNKINSGFKQTENLSNEFKKELEQFKKDLVNLKVNEYEKKQHIQDLQDKQRKLDKELNELKNNLEKLDSRTNLTEEQKEALKDKQEMLKELMDNLVTDEINKLLEEIKLLEQKLNPEQYNDLNRKLNDAFEQLDNQLNRTLELYRKYKVEESLQNALNALDKMQNEENFVDSLVTNKKPDSDLLNESLDKLKRNKDALEEYLKEADKVNSERAKSDKLSNYVEQLNELEKNIGERKSNVQDKKKVSEKTKDSKKQIKQLKEKISKDLSGMQKKEQTEDTEAIRKLLDNLLSFSFLQEKLMTSAGTLSVNQPELVKVFEKQKALKGYFEIIEDSLVQLGKRNFAVSSKINSELYNINTLFGDIDGLLSGNYLVPIATQQQSLIFHANNLAVMLKESLDNSEKEGEGGEGNESKKKSKKQKPGMEQLKSQQESLQKSLQNYLDALKKNNGNKSGLSKELSDVLSKQEMFNQMLQDLQQKGGFTPESQTILNEIRKNAENNVNDIIRNAVGTDIINRNKLIYSKLLESEKAEQEREEDDERKSETAKEYKFSIPANLKLEQNMLKMPSQGFELQNLNMYYFYRSKYKDYLNKLVE